MSYDSQAEKILSAYSQWIADHHDEGWEVYLLTFMFQPLPGGVSAQKRQMTRSIEHLYNSTFTRTVRNQRLTETFPRWVACPDRPVSKRSKISLDEATINDGLHVHALAAVSENNRRDDDYEKLLMSHHRKGDMRLIVRLDVEPIHRTPLKAARYALKALENGHSDLDDVLILPRHKSEL